MKNESKKIRTPYDSWIPRKLESRTLLLRLDQKLMVQLDSVQEAI